MRTSRNSDLICGFVVKLLTLHLLLPFCIPFWKHLMIGSLSKISEQSSFVGLERQRETNQRKAVMNSVFKVWCPGRKWLFPCGMSIPSRGLHVLAVVLSREIFQGSKAIASGHILLKLFLQGFETDSVLLVGTKLSDVETGSMGHVDHVGIGQHGELILLKEKDNGNERSCKSLGSYMTLNQETREQHWKGVTIACFRIMPMNLYKIQESSELWFAHLQSESDKIYVEESL